MAEPTDATNPPATPPTKQEGPKDDIEKLIEKTAQSAADRVRTE